MSEVMWGWQEIFMMLIFRRTPKGFYLLKSELELPQHSVMIENREADHLRLYFLTLEKARELQGPIATPTPKVPVSALEGRWMKLSACYCWKFARDGIRLSQADWDAVPDDRILELRPDLDGIEYVPVTLAQARKTAAHARESKGVELL